jgi:hypothetical protein
MVVDISFVVVKPMLDDHLEQLVVDCVHGTSRFVPEAGVECHSNRERALARVVEECFRDVDLFASGAGCAGLHSDAQGFFHALGCETRSRRDTHVDGVVPQGVPDRRAQYRVVLVAQPQAPIEMDRLESVVTLQSRKNQRTLQNRR